MPVGPTGGVAMLMDHNPAISNHTFPFEKSLSGEKHDAKEKGNSFVRKTSCPSGGLAILRIRTGMEAGAEVGAEVGLLTHLRHLFSQRICNIGVAVE